MARDAAFDTLVQAVGTALKFYPTLGGPAFGMTYGRPPHQFTFRIKG